MKGYQSLFNVGPVTEAERLARRELELIRGERISMSDWLSERRHALSMEAMSSDPARRRDALISLGTWLTARAAGIAAGQDRLAGNMPVLRLLGSEAPVTRSLITRLREMSVELDAMNASLGISQPLLRRGPIARYILGDAPAARAVRRVEALLQMEKARDEALEEISEPWRIDLVGHETFASRLGDLLLSEHIQLRVIATQYEVAGLCTVSLRAEELGRKAAELLQEHAPMPRGVVEPFTTEPANDCLFEV